VRLLGVLELLIVATAHAQQSAPLRLVQSIPLPSVEGRIDHLAVDVKGQRLFVAALGNNTVEVVDLRTGTWLRSLTGFHEPQGVAFIESLARLFVSNGGTGVVNSFDGETLQPLGTVKFSGDADNLRYDTAAGQLYLGYGDGTLGILDAKDGRQVGDLKLAGHPESFELENAGTRIFVNVPDARQIAVVDRFSRRVVTTWALPDARANFPMGLDEVNHRLFVGFRQPARLIIFDTEAGKVVASLDSAGDADDLFYDRERQRIYLSGGEGFIDVFAQRDADHYALNVKVPTVAGARTSLWAPPLHRFFLAVPHRGAQAAEIRVYDVE
jgi:glutamine cyclotransferase